MTQGDVMAVLATLIGICISSWSLTMAYGLLFPGKSQVAKHEVATRPGKCISRGALILFTVGLVGLGLVSKAPNPLLKLIGWVTLLTIFTVAALGMAGLALNAGDRLKVMAPEMNPYAAFSRGAGFLIFACIVPIVGWFAFGPLLYLAAIGAGVKAVLTPVDEPSSLPQAEIA